jgi:hypothetical protein
MRAVKVVRKVHKGVDLGFKAYEFMKEAEKAEEEQVRELDGQRGGVSAEDTLRQRGWSDADLRRQGYIE